ncbi:hypothetical protein HYG86_05850 [Alkalicella caledoniensis]|uniref:Uncharacterized protein n=1 Tax=Alkalicella caledoniensis TaxID=2731377 RepID=A0A7G9W6L7_ALKCA|nr:hypothetical protein [Alkalicella caledoniensis]QNO14329.1 hypothetical protein HYG86_05850 [Alkalicella caledoniensis]
MIELGRLGAESIKGQLTGTIPATSRGRQPGGGQRTMPGGKADNPQGMNRHTGTMQVVCWRQLVLIQTMPY